MEIYPHTNLTPLIGQRVIISGFRFATIDSIHHGAAARHAALRNGVWGLLREEPRPDFRGGSSAFYFDYGISMTPTC